MRTLFFSLISLFFAFYSTSQEHTLALQKKESELSQILSNLRSTKDDKKIDKINKQFINKFKKALEMEGAIDYPFSSLKSIGDIQSDNQRVRIFSWNVQYQDLSNNYFSFIMKKDKRRGGINVIELKRQGPHIKMAQRENIDNENWYGALYYDIIEVQKRNRTFYTLLGYDYNNQKSRIKFIDVLYFSGSKPHFGYPLFKEDRNRSKRVLLEYSSDAVMSLRYDDDRELIVFDHLSPKTQKLKEFKEFYVPDMSYDAYSWDGNYWNLKEDIITNNKEVSERKKVDLKAYDSDMDSVVTVSEKSTWIDPTDSKSPIDGGQHKAVTPEDIQKEKERKKSNEVRKNRNKTTYPHRRSKSKRNGVSYSNLNERLDKGKKKKKRKKK